MKRWLHDVLFALMMAVAFVVVIAALVEIILLMSRL